MKSRQEIAADWIMRNKGADRRAYRQECMTCWRALYGEQFVVEVEKLVRARWDK